jgi:sugar phosphate isomerase/epimerase
MANTPAIPAALAIDGLTNLDARASFDVAASAGYRGIAFATSHAELNPEALGPSARRHVRTILGTKGLGIESLRAAAPRGGLTDAATIDRSLENARKGIVLARELGIRTVSLNVGRLGHQAGLTESTIIAALRELAQQADASGLTLALAAEGGVEALARIIKAVDFDRARINLDAARAIGEGENLLSGAEWAAGRIGQFTAADAIKSGRGVRAVPLGEGQLPLRELAGLLRDHGFQGPWVVDVRDLADGADAARRAAALLRKFLP